jgi:hypothetical protein
MKAPKIDVLLILSFLTLFPGCVKSSRAAIDATKSNYLFIRNALEDATRASGRSMSELLACTNDIAEEVRIVSAERVFKGVEATGAGGPYWHGFFVDGFVSKDAKPLNPDGATALEKWGSSYNSWCMSKEKWDLAFAFTELRASVDGHNAFKELTAGFPILWVKRPEFYGDTVVYLSTTEKGELSSSRFRNYLAEATQWLNPQQVDLDELLRMAKSDETGKRIYALRVLGARKDPMQIQAIGPAIRDEDFEVRSAAIWALGWIGHSDAIRLLEPMLDEKTITEEIAVALGRIGGDAAVPLLVTILKDDNLNARRKAIVSLGETKSPSAVEPLQTFLRDSTDPFSKDLARKALSRLGWKPDR